MQEGRGEHGEHRRRRRGPTYAGAGQTGVGMRVWVEENNKAKEQYCQRIEERGAGEGIPRLVGGGRGGLRVSAKPRKSARTKTRIEETKW